MVPEDEGTRATAPASLQLESFLPYQLNMLASEISQTMARAYGKRFGISIPEWRILATLGQFEVMTARDVGAHSRMHKTTVSRAVATLEKRKLITRKANRSDLREAFLTLTDAGTAVYRDIVPMAAGFSDALCASLSVSERAVLDDLLGRLADQVDRLAATS